MGSRGWRAFALVGIAIAFIGRGDAGAQIPDAPVRLVVLVSVDQLRGDLTERYADAFEGGLRRLMDGGWRYTGASHLHAGTYTAAGHATLATGVLPSRNGIVANDWTQRVGDGWVPDMYAVQDEASPLLGLEHLPADEGRSPRNVLASGLADWVQAADGGARTVSISGKDRSAITMGGLGRGHVYWINRDAGRFVTSHHYRMEYPEWVDRFNDEAMPRLLESRVWTSSVPERWRSLARPDEGPVYEGDGVHTTFPHDADVEIPGADQEAFNDWALDQPRIDEAVFGLAREAVDALELGRRGPVDYLGLSLSAADYVGHAYGPLSLEQLDNLLRLDAELGTFFDFLDDRVGAGRWVVALSGDHGVATIPEVQAAEGLGGRRIDEWERGALLERALAEARTVAGDDGDRLAETLARMLEARGLVAQAYTHRELLAGEPSDSFAVLFRNSHYPGRAAQSYSTLGVEGRFQAQDLVTRYNGTTHGSPYWYDRWVPFMLMGPGVPAGVSDAAVYTIDVAPTLAALAGVPSPSDRDGNVRRPGG